MFCNGAGVGMGMGWFWNGMGWDGMEGYGAYWLVGFGFEFWSRKGKERKGEARKGMERNGPRERRILLFTLVHLVHLCL